MLNRYSNSVEIMASNTMVELLTLCLASPTLGRIKSACEAVYNKQQGRFYSIEVDGETVGILGYRIIDRTCELIHAFYHHEHLSAKGYAEHIRMALALDGLNQAQIIVHEKDKAFYHGLGFNCKPYKENDMGFNQFYCVLKA